MEGHDRRKSLAWAMFSKYIYVFNTRMDLKAELGIFLNIRKAMFLNKRRFRKAFKVSKISVNKRGSP